jgi:hypothetical protein
VEEDEMTFSTLLATRLTISTGEPLEPPFARCAICGGECPGRSHDIDDVCGSLTTDLSSFRAPSSRDVCPGCALVRGRSQNPPGRASGWYCNFSHFIDADRYENASKGEKPRILAWLRGPKRAPWSCAIADTGQKHIVCYAPLNLGGRGRVRFEEADVALPDEAGWKIVDDLVTLLTAGATKEEIETGRYTARAYALCGESLRVFEREFGRLRGSAWFGLALWLSQRDEAAVAGRLEREKATKAKKTSGKKPRKVVEGGEREAAGGDPNEAGGDGLGVSPGLPPDVWGEHAGTLANHLGPDVPGIAADQERGRVGHEGHATAPDPATGQLGLFGAAGP